MTFSMIINESLVARTFGSYSAKALNIDPGSLWVPVLAVGLVASAWIYRHFPLEFHNPLAQLEAEASEYASELGGNDAFWLYADLLYERTSSNGNGLSPDVLEPFVQDKTSSTD